MSEQFPNGSWDEREADVSELDAPESEDQSINSLNDTDAMDQDADVEEASPGQAADRASSDPGSSDSVPVTGLDSVDRVLAKEAAVSELSVNERAAAYQELHAELESILNQQPGSLPTGLTGQ